MARLTPLRDLQLQLLTAACQRPDGSLLPVAVAIPAPRVARAIVLLLKHEHVVEIDVIDPALAWRSADDRHIGAIATAAGYAAVGVPMPAFEPVSPPTPGPVPNVKAKREAAALAGPAKQKQAAIPLPSARAGTKQAIVVALLQRANGASIDELTSATGWLPHTTRAALTGLRKKGHAISNARVAGLSHYRIAVG